MKQGDPRPLFNVAIEEIFRKLHWDSYGLRINGPKLNNLRFADCVAIVANSSRETLLHELKQVDLR